MDVLRPLLTVRSRKHAALAAHLDLTPEEHKQRADAADALFREMKRRRSTTAATRRLSELCPRHRLP